MDSVFGKAIEYANNFENRSDIALPFEDRLLLALGECILYSFLNYHLSRKFIGRMERFLA